MNLTISLRRLLAWLRRPISCERCRAPAATFVPNEEKYLCARCAGRLR